MSRSSAAAPIALLLAGGSGRRFGGDKLLARLDGVPLAVLAARVYLAAGLETHAILRPEQATLTEALRAEGIVVHHSADCRAGMGHSLAAGVSAAPSRGGWLVGLADMPWLRADTVRAVAGALEAGAEFAAPRVAGRRGHPVGFSAACGAALRRLQGDEGARALLAEAGARLTLIDCSDAGALRDVDLPADLRT